MSQVIFTNPIVTSQVGPTGTGNGTLSIDRLTHFTITQSYTLTCIAKSPDTLFAIVGSLDGAVGIATVGTQFFDEDLKIFLTIQQGSTVFEVGDQFTVSVQNGTDLNQENIDEYDEYPQKNFGTGTLGVSEGDSNLRYANTALFAFTYLHDLKFTALASGASGNSITVQYVSDGTAGAETVTVVSSTITVHMASGKSTATQIKAALDGSAPAAALISTSIVGAGAAPQFGMSSAVSLSGGKNKNYAFNHNELTDPGPFTEGNANVRIRDLRAIGNAEVTGQGFFGGSLALNDSVAANVSGPAVGNVQKYLNRFMSRAKIEVSTVSDVFLAWTAPNLTSASNIEIYFRDSAIKNTIDMTSGISLTDGQSAYVMLNPEATGFVSVVAATSIPTDLHAYRLCTRVGALLVMYNGTVLAAGESARIGTTGSATSNVTNALVRRDSSGNFTANIGTFAKVLIAPGVGNGLDVSSAGDMYVGASVGANSMFLGGAGSTVVVVGDFVVQGNSTTLNTATLDVEDKNITISKNGNDVASEGAGLTIDRTGTKGSLIYAAAAVSRFKIGDLGSEVEVADIASAQSFTNKTLAAALNHITSTPARAAQFNFSTGDLEPSGVTNTELGYLSGVTSSIQTQLDGKLSAAAYRSGAQALSSGDTSVTVTFSSPFSSTNYRVIAQLTNLIDSTTQHQPVTITFKSTSAFSAKWNGGVDSASYVLTFIAMVDN